ncbi:MAG: right-handed parallel beta-helix repeat-containing protein [Spirochaetes bacterium]|nr:right-handed parallel beta-helix repeat-containing protein [Spirochaetota bacterium]
MKKYWVCILLLCVRNVFSLDMNNIQFWKYNQNPILMMSGWLWESRCVYHPAVITNNGLFYMFYRGQDWRNRLDPQWYLSYGISGIGLATSSDGLNFTRMTNINPVIRTNGYGTYDEKGCEDPRIVKISNRYYITYNGYCRTTVGPEIKICLASSSNLTSWVKHGEISGDGTFDNKKHGAILPIKVNGKYWMYFGDSDLYLASSPNDPPVSAGNPWSGWTIENSGNPIMTRRSGKFDSHAIRPGPSPMQDSDGILLIYNGTTDDPSLAGRYVHTLKTEIGWVIFSNTNPAKIKERCEEPILSITKKYEQLGNVYNSVYASGFAKGSTNHHLYYSCADWCIGVATGGTNIQAIPRTYYVNDESTVGDTWCTAPGNDLNDGLSTNSPMRQIKTVFETYPLCGGSEIRVDRGSYSGGDMYINSINKGGETNYLIIRGIGNNPTTGSVINAGGSSTECFKAEDSNHVKIIDLHCKAATENIILLNHCSNVIISNCWIKQSSKHGITLINSTDNKIIRNKIGDSSDANGNDGIFMENSCNNLIFKNEVWNNGWAGLDMRNSSSSNTILSNDIHHNNEEGTKVHKGGGNASIYNKIAGNKIYNNNDSNGADKGGIRIIENSDHSELRDNQVYLNKREWNIGIRNARNCVISNNTVYNCVDAGGGERVGMGFWNVTNTLICDNEIYGNPYDGIKMTDDSLSNRIEYNRVYNNSQHGILINVNSTDNRLFRNLSYYNTSEGIRIDNNSDRALIINNTSFRNGKGILFDNNVDSCILRNNIAISNANEGIQVAQSAEVTNSYNDSYGNGGGNYVESSGGIFRTGPDNLSVDALFQSTDTGSPSFLWISSNSPCTNRGCPSDPIPPGGGSRVDIGRFEYMTNGSGCVFFVPPVNQPDERKAYLDIFEPGDALSPGLCFITCTGKKQDSVLTFIYKTF